VSTGCAMEMLHSDERRGKMLRMKASLRQVDARTVNVDWIVGKEVIEC